MSHSVTLSPIHSPSGDHLLTPIVPETSNLAGYKVARTKRCSICALISSIFKSIKSAIVGFFNLFRSNQTKPTPKPVPSIVPLSPRLNDQPNSVTSNADIGNLLGRDALPTPHNETSTTTPSSKVTVSEQVLPALAVPTSSSSTSSLAQSYNPLFGEPKTNQEELFFPQPSSTTVPISTSATPPSVIEVQPSVSSKPTDTTTTTTLASNLRVSEQPISPSPISTSSSSTSSSAYISNEERTAINEKLCKYGTVSFGLYPDYLYIEVMSSNIRGGGTAIIREMVQFSQEKGRQGNIHLQAAWNSHLFHTYMGMMPVEREINAREVWGRVGCKALNSVSKIIETLKEKELTDPQDQENLNELKEILAQEDNLDVKEVSDKLIIENEERLKSLLDKKYSYITHIFIENVLEALETTQPGQEVRLAHLATVNMHLSPLALERWKEAISNEKAFTPFKNLEHLKDFMTPAQLKRIKHITDKNLATQK